MLMHACLYIFSRITVSYMGDWDYKMFWQRNIHEVMFNFVEESELMLESSLF